MNGPMSAFLGSLFLSPNSHQESARRKCSGNTPPPSGQHPAPRSPPVRGLSWNWLLPGIPLMGRIPVRLRFGVQTLLIKYNFAGSRTLNSSCCQHCGKESSLGNTPVLEGRRRGQDRPRERGAGLGVSRDSKKKGEDGREGGVGVGTWQWQEGRDGFAQRRHCTGVIGRAWMGDSHRTWNSVPAPSGPWCAVRGAHAEAELALYPLAEQGTVTRLPWQAGRLTLQGWTLILHSWSVGIAP